jgi:hypothetical protein
MQYEITAVLMWLSRMAVRDRCRHRITTSLGSQWTDLMISFDRLYTYHQQFHTEPDFFTLRIVSYYFSTFYYTPAFPLNIHHHEIPHASL